MTIVYWGFDKFNEKFERLPTLYEIDLNKSNIIIRIEKEICAMDDR